MVAVLLLSPSAVAAICESPDLALVIVVAVLGFVASALAMLVDIAVGSIRWWRQHGTADRTVRDVRAHEAGL